MLQYQMILWEVVVAVVGLFLKLGITVFQSRRFPIQGHLR
jgi:hypothetical protein